MKAEIRNYNFLIIGKSGAGKSATTKLLTGNQNITVANSFNQVTKEANFYEGKVVQINQKLVKFNILDVPGLDKLNNRFVIRQQILNILQTKKIGLNGILYISSLTQRDTIDNEKVFKFINQLPWVSELKKNALIPIFTKYDNLIIDSQDQQIRSTKNELKQIFHKLNYSSAWSKRVYWINNTKSLQFKIKTYAQIKITYQKQVERLIQMINRTKTLLTAKDIKTNIEEQQKYILIKLFDNIRKKQLPYKLQKKQHGLTVKIQIQPKQYFQSVTALSASSIGLFIAKVCQRDISTFASIILMSVPIGVALLNFQSPTTLLQGKKTSQQSSGIQLLKTYQRICNLINLQLQNQWKLLNHMIQFKSGSNTLYCIISGKNNFKFIDFSQIVLSIQQTRFQLLNLSQIQIIKDQENMSLQNIDQYQQIDLKFKFDMPKFQKQDIWQPEIKIQYGIKVFDEQIILKEIQKIRHEYYNCKI